MGADIGLTVWSLCAIIMAYNGTSRKGSKAYLSLIMEFLIKSNSL